MIRVIMHGCNGYMGQVITGLARDEEDLEIVTGIDVVDNRDNGYPVYTCPADCWEEADVLIDFSNAKAADSLLAYCADRKLPVVLCTTGLSPEQLEKVKQTSEKIAVLRSANMSLGVNILLKLVKEAAETLAQAGFDMEIVEKHHNRKLDAPSGTALALADAAAEGASNGEYSYTYDRSALHRKRDPKEIGISSVRGGTIVGDHDVIFAGTDEVITLSHSAYSRAVFGKGALAAARFLAGNPAGLYSMSDVIA
ncbi:MAG: 4-hydroxy-tetrahydrodipicolinate reductase [Lachnospiraceae bacterium]|nr:4-hydroxy-tetrahydrodipicolinate reductase [Lachnospiraceae bacterium]